MEINVNDLVITVAGAAGTGKSFLTHKLKKFLREEGFEVEFSSTEDFTTEETFDAHMGTKDLKVMEENVKQNRKIILREVMLKQNVKYDGMY